MGRGARSKHRGSGTNCLQEPGVRRAADSVGGKSGDSLGF